MGFNLKDLRKEIKGLSKINESFVFDDEAEDDVNVSGLDKTEDSVETDKSEIDEDINSIRGLALHGLQRFSDKVMSKEYQTFKKIWAICDKVLTDEAVEE